MNANIAGLLPLYRSDDRISRSQPNPMIAGIAAAFPGSTADLDALFDLHPRRRGPEPRVSGFRPGYVPTGLLEAPADYERRRASFLGRAL